MGSLVDASIEANTRSRGGLRPATSARRRSTRRRGRQLVVEEAFGVDVGHAKTVAFIERHIRKLEGERGVSSER